MSSKSTKVLVSGDVNGNFEQLIKRVSAVNKKSGPFDMLLCVGEFFGPEDEDNQRVVEGEIEFPINTYILGPCCPSTSKYYPEKSAEFSPNLTYLGKRGVLNTTTGLQIAYLSGIEGPQANSFQFDVNSVEECLTPVKVHSGFLGIDILVTSMWPAEVAKYSPNQPTREVEGSRLISKLAAGLKPRYHFAGLGSHYERAPYRNHRVLLEAAQHTTRFIGLAPVANKDKMKWLYAFSVIPMRKMDRTTLVEQPPNASEFPYMTVLAEIILEDRAVMLKDQSFVDRQYFYDMSEPKEDNVDRGGKRRYDSNVDGPPYRQARVQQPCWFCLSNVDVEKYLIITVGEFCYAAMPKGPLTDDHVIILPISHVQSTVASTAEIREELQKFKNAFTQMYNKYGKLPVIFERNYKSQHLQLQIVPVPKSCSKVLKSSFVNAAQLHNIDFVFLDSDQQIWDIVNEGCPYFYVELPDGSRLFSLKMRNFPIQFAREVLSGHTILNCEEKVDWRACEIEKNIQTELVKSLQKSFKPFDFTEELDDND